MAEDWHAVADEVAEALASVGQTDDGFRGVLKRNTRSGASPNPWTPPSGPPTYEEFVIVEILKELRDANGMLTGETRRTLLLPSIGLVVPETGDEICLGVTAATAPGAPPDAWVEVLACRTVAPAGIPVLYEVDIGVNDG